jgi:RNA-binding protein NOB1
MTQTRLEEKFFVVEGLMKSWASIVSSNVHEKPKRVVAPNDEQQSLSVPEPAIHQPSQPDQHRPFRPAGPRKRVVVVDTNSIINNVSFASLGDQFVTVSEVLEEVRDPEARRRLENMTMLTTLETRVPSKDAVAKVVAFANSTGDFAVLSGADIKLIALTRMIEVELNGETQLRALPVAQAQVYTKPDSNEQQVEMDDEEDDEKDSFYDECVMEEGGEVGEETDADSVHSHVVPQETSKLAAAPSPAARGPVRTPVARKGDANVSLPGWGSDWVSNAEQLKGESKGEVAQEPAEEEGSSVTCLTADFAMQNVLLQMGLKVLSPDGKRITRVKQWALRCYTCFKITRNMEKQFCPQVSKKKTRK